MPAVFSPCCRSSSANVTFYLQLIKVFFASWLGLVGLGSMIRVRVSFSVTYTQGDSDVISSYHIYASCFSATL